MVREENHAAIAALGEQRPKPRDLIVREPAFLVRAVESHEEPVVVLISDVETVAEKLVAEIRATKPVHVCFSFKVGNTPHTAAMRSMELMIGEVKPRVEKALGPLGRVAAE